MGLFKKKNKKVFKDALIQPTTVVLDICPREFAAGNRD